MLVENWLVDHIIACWRHGAQDLFKHWLEPNLFLCLGRFCQFGRFHVSAGGGRGVSLPVVLHPDSHTEALCFPLVACWPQPRSLLPNGPWELLNPRESIAYYHLFSSDMACHDKQMHFFLWLSLSRSLSKKRSQAYSCANYQLVDFSWCHLIHVLPRISSHTLFFCQESHNPSKSLLMCDASEWP